MAGTGATAVGEALVACADRLLELCNNGSATSTEFITAIPTLVGMLNVRDTRKKTLQIMLKTSEQYDASALDSWGDKTTIVSDVCSELHQAGAVPRLVAILVKVKLSELDTSAAAVRALANIFHWAGSMGVEALSNPARQATEAGCMPTLLNLLQLVTANPRTLHAEASRTNVVAFVLKAITRFVGRSRAPQS